jgi:hypothetical protein
MSATRNPGRFVGTVYALVSIPGAFALIYVPSRLIVHGDAVATATNIAGSETLFRLGIASTLVMQTLFLWVALTLYDLLKGVNLRYAAMMLTLIGVSLPIAMLNELNAVAALLLVRGPAFLSVFDKPQRDALAMLFLNLHSQGLGIAELFWGLWLLPMGLLVYRSGFLPRLLGVLLVLNGVHYLAISLTSLVWPEAEVAVARWITPFQFGELVFMFWLLIVGARPPVPALATAK